MHTVFTLADINRKGEFPRIRLINHKKELLSCPLWYHKQGLQQTVTGYGGKLNTGLKLQLGSRLYRVYSMFYGNSGTTYIIVKGETIYVD